MPKSTAPGLIPTYEALGVSFASVNGQANVQAEECPFCGRERFYVEATKGTYQCKHASCKAKGNIYTFMQSRLEAHAAIPAPIKNRFRRERSIPPQRINEYGLGYDTAQNMWMLPYRNLKGTVKNIERYYWDKKKKPNKFALPKLDTCLFGLEQLPKRNQDAMILLCEGALDAMAVDSCIGSKHRNRYCVLGVPGGFKKEWAQLFKGRKVRLLFDNDNGGREHTNQVQELLYKTVAELRVLQWPEGYDDYDMSDFILEEKPSNLAEWMREHSYKYRRPTKLAMRHAWEHQEEEPEEIPWWWPNHIRTGTYVSFSGPQGTNKSLVAIDLCARHTSGRLMPFCKEQGLPPSHVIYVTAEDSKRTVENHFRRLKGNPRLFTTIGASMEDGQQLNVLDSLEEIESAVRQFGTRMVVIDGQNSVLGGSDIGTDMRGRVNVTNKLHQFAQRLNIAVMGIRNEDQQGRAYGPASMRDLARCVLRVDKVPAGKQQAEHFLLRFVKVSDAAPSTHPPIPFTMKDLGGNKRSPQWQSKAPRKTAPKIRFREKGK